MMTEKEENILHLVRCLGTYRTDPRQSMIYKKIQHPDEEVIITKGTILIEFPVDGSSAETIDLSRPELFRLYEVEKKVKGVIIASCADQSAEDILQKPVTQLVRESRWWMDNEM